MIQRKAELLSKRQATTQIPTDPASSSAVTPASSTRSSSVSQADQPSTQQTPLFTDDAGEADFWLPQAFSHPLPLPVFAPSDTPVSGSATHFDYRLATLSLRLPGSRAQRTSSSSSASKKQGNKETEYWGTARRAPPGLGAGSAAERTRQRKLNSALHVAVTTTPERALRFVELSSGEGISCSSSTSTTTAPAAASTAPALRRLGSSCMAPALVHSTPGSSLTHVAAVSDGAEAGLLVTASSDGSVAVWSVSAVWGNPLPAATTAGSAQQQEEEGAEAVVRVKLVREGMLAPIPVSSTTTSATADAAASDSASASATAPASDGAVVVAADSSADVAVSGVQHVTAALVFVRRRQTFVVLGYDNGRVRYDAL